MAAEWKETLETEREISAFMRNAVEVSWERGNPEVFEDLFGFSRETGAPRPTNSEYIARIADKIRMDATTGEKHVTERNRTLL